MTRGAAAFLVVLALLCCAVHGELFHARIRYGTAPTDVEALEASADRRLLLINATSAEQVREQLTRSRALTDAQVFVDRVRPARVGTTPGSWGQDRVDQRTVTLNDDYAPLYTGEGVTAWVVDTGIEATHADFEDRAETAFSAYTPSEDCHGHGTHVSSTLGGAQYGIAPEVDIRAVKVLDCFGYGTTYTVAQGLQWVLDHLTGRDVINLSLGYSARDSVIESLLADLYDAGAVAVAAAGNSDANACNHFPSSHATVLSVGATTTSDARASYSNYGSCVDVMAPGSGIRAARLGGGSTTMSGTSMATPHVAGAAALLLSLQNYTGVADVRPALLSVATSGVLSSLAGSPNLLVWVHSNSTVPVPPPAAPGSATAPAAALCLTTAAMLAALLLG